MNRQTTWTAMSSQQFSQQ